MNLVFGSGISTPLQTTLLSGVRVSRVVKRGSCENKTDGPVVGHKIPQRPRTG